ncbi:PAS domain-containing sensor histidine kinase [Alphaproteobacteria bacterium KMM 3653]|uniref:histidine kinase n=1 Tax=Harenicola maris TaxID=2841044 RepID=A0AAP2CPM5_9RHOB|nr:PAS domain-containing sensor histidine kinase [Harenicola maris]
MDASDRTSLWDRLVALRRNRAVQTGLTLALVVLGPALAVTTYLILGPWGQGANSGSLRLILLADMVYVLILATLVLWRVGSAIAARRRQSAGSRLHLRLTGVFALIALLPTVIVGLFAGLTINMGLESWFSDRVRGAIGASLAAAQAYAEEHRADLGEDAAILAGYLNLARTTQPLADADNMRQLLSQAQELVQRGLREAFIIDGEGEIRVRGDRSYKFDYERPTDEEILRAAQGETVFIEDWTNNEFRALLALTAIPNRYIYVSREVDGNLLALLDETRTTAAFYQQLETDRGRRLFEFGLIYLGFAMILILAAIWLGLWFAERLSRPVGRLAGAAQQVGAGDLDVRVREEEGDDEIAMLGRLFNQMTRQLKGQRDTLLERSDQIERRRRLFDSVLSSVTSGVIGLNSKGEIDFMNRSANRLLELDEAEETHGHLEVVVPEFSPLLEKLKDGPRETTQGEVRLIRSGKQESLLVRMSTRRSDEDALEGYVVAFDDVTELVSAQRMAAWGDVARRIAHEIKNPLTPIQLSAERLKRKFSPKVGDESEALEQMTDVIIRQTGDLRRIVDEFSKFARMPEPDRRRADITALVRDAALLQQQAQGEQVKLSLPDMPIWGDVDETMIGQALTNLIKNAGEAIETLSENGLPDGFTPEVRVALTTDGPDALITIADNGVGLPEDRARLFEPYVTTRDAGTGLGLPIVKKIIEEHGGTLVLTDAPVFANNTHTGAMAEIRLPGAEAVAAAAE